MNRKITSKIIHVASRIIPFVCTVAMAQTPGQWTWMHGDNTTNSLGNFGAMGVPSASNKPPAVYEPCGEWRDNQGNFWFFGGVRVSAFPKNYSALWKYDVAANKWTWMKGPSAVDQIGVYGTQGVADPANTPGSRGWGACTWVDKAGNFWLFGGSGYNSVGQAGRLNDLWKYDVASNQWTWMHGPYNVTNDPGSYGTKGVAIPANLPPSRDEVACSWVDNAGNLWLYGGNEPGVDCYGDLWKYDISINQWTWMHGTNTLNAPAVYGTLNVPAPANTPGGRWPFATWTDLSGKFWLFGGSSRPSGIKNDMWMYDPAINQWTWKGGNASANYGTKCVAASSNLPPAKSENRPRVMDACGNFWMFGSNNLTSNSWAANDLWHYNVSTGLWTWISGDNTGNPSTAVYGIKGVSSPANKPGGRSGGTAWMDNSGNIWIFGGFYNISFNMYAYNDLWRFVPDTTCIPCTVSSSLAATVSSVNLLCNGKCTGTATATPSNGASPYTYSWNTIPAQTTQTATGLCAGAYTVTVTDAAGSTAIAAVTITQPTLLTATVSSASSACGSNNGSATINAGGGTPGYTYNWSNGQATSTATGLVAGNYTATITDANGCTQTQTVTVTSNNALNVTVSSTQTGCTVNNGTATATPLNGTDPYTYSWSNGQITQTATGMGTGTYTVTVTDSSGCTQIQSVSVTQIPGPMAAVSASSNTIIIGAGTTLTASGGGTYNWSPSTGLSCITCSTSTAFPSSTTIYCVTVTDTSGCSDSACVTVMVEMDCSNTGKLYLPNAFSPNNDGENDKLQIYYGNPKCIKTFNLVIYNRWGEEVFKTENPIEQWDGSYEGRIASTAVFVYYLAATLLSGEEIMRKGNISLIRY